MAQNVEWLGGRYTLPHSVREGDGSYQPQVIVWLELPRGVLVGSTLGGPGEAVSLATSLQAAMERPLEGPPRRPSRIRVGDRRTADELRAAAIGIPIVVAPVPELDDTFDQLAEALGDGAPEPSYLGDGEISPQLVGEMFKAASLLFRTAPWRHLSDQQILRVDIPRLGIDGACLSVIGAAGESLGLLLFNSIGDFHTLAERRAEGGGRLALRSLSFSAKEELPPSLVREVEQHRWLVAGANAYPIAICVAADLSRIAVTEKDVRILTAVARAFLAFFARHRDLFDSDDPEPVRESSEGEDGVQVTLTAPYVVAPSPRAAGRNDPCPCGSGKKYKKCHLDIDAAPRRKAAELESVHQMDFRLVLAMARFASSRFGPDWLGVEPEDEEEDALELILPWATWTAEVDGRRVADSYLEQQGSRIPPEDRDWFAAQQAAWLSVWEVTAVAPGSVEARDLLTGETRNVREGLGSRTLRARDTVLARLIDYRGVSYFGGMYTRALTPMAAAAVVDAVRRKLRSRRAAVPAARLRDRETGWFLIDHWAAAVEDGSKPPALQNTDGDPLQFVTDSFRFDAAMRAAIEQRIEAMDGFANASVEKGERVHIFMRAADATVIGHVRVGDGTLSVETSSEPRADALARRVEDACAGMLGEPQRTVEPLSSAFDAAPDQPADGLGDEKLAVLREYKQNHYRQWLDMPLPALGGKTPRDATRSAKSRRELDLVLRQIENHEIRLPEAERLDVGALRRELGMEG